MPVIFPLQSTDVDVHVPLTVEPDCEMVMPNCIVALLDEAKVPLQAPEMSVAAPTFDGPLGLEHADATLRAQMTSKRRINPRRGIDNFPASREAREIGAARAPARVRARAAVEFRARSYSSVLTYNVPCPFSIS